jgi:hypothetical protein
LLAQGWTSACVPRLSSKHLGDLDDVRTYLHKARLAAALIYVHFKKEVVTPSKK